MRRFALAGIPVVLALGGVETAHAQRGTGDWMTTAYDAQRSSWVRTDGKISPTAMRKPGFELVWKRKVDNAARGLNNLTPPALLDFYIGYRGFRSLGFFGGSSDYLLAVDTDLARTEWQKNFSPSQGAKADSVDCPGGLTSAVTRPTQTAYPPLPAGRGSGRGSPAKSAVGEPHEGAALLKTMAARMPPRPAAPARPRTTTPAFNPFAPRVQYAVALTGDGKLHSLWVSNGNEPNPAVAFLPPNANAQGLIVYGDTAYAGTTNQCGGAANGVWALDLNTGKVRNWKASGNLGGTAGPAAGPDGTLYAAAGKELTALAAGTLQPLAAYRTSGAEFTSSPVVFEFHGKDLIAAATNDGRLQLLDSAALGGAPLAQSEPFSAPDFAAGSVTSWQDLSGNRWILAAAGGPFGEIRSGAVVAFQVVESGGKIALQRAWVSRDMVSPLPPIVVNGVVFAVGSGEFRTKDASVGAAKRIERSVPAVLYALDGATGKELWNSGKAITSFVHSGGLSAGGSRVYVSAYDGTQYSFGYPIEH